MIDPKQIPDEVEEAYVDAFYGKDMTRKEAIAAAINAWPDMECRPTFGPNRIILPLKDVQNTER